jgi:hypothetical protein
MGKIRLVYVLFGISPRIWNGLRTYTEVPLYFLSVILASFAYVAKLQRCIASMEIKIHIFVISVLVEADN